MVRPGRLELADRSGVERVDCSNDFAVERGIELAPLTAGNDRTCRQTEWREHPSDTQRVRREHFAQQGHCRTVGFARNGGLDGASLHFLAGVIEHRTSQHILGFGVGGNAETRHIDADDPHPVDFIRQQAQRHAGRGGHAQVGDDDRVVPIRVGHVVDRFADIFEQLAGDQRFGIERHIADRPARTVEMRHEGQAVDATGRSRQHRRRAAHPQAHAQRAKGGAHAIAACHADLAGNPWHIDQGCRTCPPCGPPFPFPTRRRDSPCRHRLAAGWPMPVQQDRHALRRGSPPPRRCRRI